MKFQLMRGVEYVWIRGSASKCLRVIPSLRYAVPLSYRCNIIKLNSDSDWRICYDEV